MKKYIQALSRPLSTAELLTLEALRDIANTHTMQGCFDDARVILGQLLAASERLLGGKHAFTLSILTGLGDVHSGQGTYQKAFQLYGRALAGYEETLGRSHPDTLAAVAMIGMLYVVRGQLRTALPLLLRAIAGLESIHGAEHPCVLVIVAVVATIYNMGMYPGALEFIETALERMKRVLGEDHPLTKEMAANLAGLLFKYGRYQEAQSIIRGVGLNSTNSAGVGRTEGVALNRGRQWYFGWHWIAIVFILGIYFFPKCTIAAGVLLGGCCLPKWMIIGGILLGFFIYQWV